MKFKQGDKVIDRDGNTGRIIQCTVSYGCNEYRLKYEDGYCDTWPESLLKISDE